MRELILQKKQTKKNKKKKKKKKKTEAIYHLYSKSDTLHVAASRTL